MPLHMYAQQYSMLHAWPPLHPASIALHTLHCTALSQPFACSSIPHCLPSWHAPTPCATGHPVASATLHTRLLFLFRIEPHCPIALTSTTGCSAPCCPHPIWHVASTLVGSLSHVHQKYQSFNWSLGWSVQPMLHHQKPHSPAPPVALRLNRVDAKGGDLRADPQQNKRGVWAGAHRKVDAGRGKRMEGLCWGVRRRWQGCTWVCMDQRQIRVPPVLCSTCTPRGVCTRTQFHTRARTHTHVCTHTRKRMLVKTSRGSPMQC